VAGGTSSDGTDYTTLFEIGTTPPPSIDSSASSTFVQGLSGSFTVTTTGSPTPSITEAGPLPTGVAFADNGDGTGTLSGTPAVGSAGTYPITITASDGILPDATQHFTLTVVSIEVTTTSLASGTAGTSYTSTLAAIGGNPPYTWKLAVGVLPKGIRLDKKTGVISGKTKQVGTVHFTVEVLDTKMKRSKGHPATQNTATAPLSITIDPS
jgi:hypothetical protein